MSKFRKYIANTVQFFYEETFFLFLALLLLVGVYESYYLVELLKIPHNLDPQTLKIFEDFFKTPFGEYIILGVFLSYIIIETIFLFFFFLGILRFLLSFKYFMIGYYPDEMDTPERVRYSLYLMYFHNAKRFEMAGTPILCCKCSTVVPKSDYIQNYGYCSVCRKLLDDTATIWHFGDDTD